MRVNTRIRNIIHSIQEKYSTSQYCHPPLQVGKSANYAGKLYTSKDLLIHQRTIHGKLKFECHICPNITVRKDNLVSHQKTHTESPSYQSLNRKRKALKLKHNYHLRKSMSPKNLNNCPTINRRSHIKSHLHLLNHYN